METLNINKTKYKTKNYYKTKSVKTQIVIGCSLRAGSNHIVRLKHKNFGESKSWPTYSITREGVVYEHFDSSYHSDFLGIKEGDVKSVSIMLENMVHLYKKDNTYVNFIDEVCTSKNIVKKKSGDFNYWEGFPEEQLDGLTKLCQIICDKHNIPKNVIDFHHYNKDIGKYKGIVLKGNYVNGSTETSPVLNLFELGDRISQLSLHPANI